MVSAFSSSKRIQGNNVEIFETVEKVVLDSDPTTPPSLSYVCAHRPKSVGPAEKQFPNTRPKYLDVSSKQKFLAHSPLMNFQRSEMKKRRNDKELFSAEGSYLATWLRK